MVGKGVGMRLEELSNLVKDERRVLQVFKKHNGPAFRAWFSDSLIDFGWKTRLKVKRDLNSYRVLKSPKGKVVDPFKGYRKSIDFAVSKIEQPGFYFVLNWGVVPSQAQINRLRKVVREFSKENKEIALFRLKRLGVWFMLIGREGESSFFAKPNSIDKKYFEAIYKADEEDEYFVEVDIDIHSHPDDLDVSLSDREYAKDAKNSTKFFVVTYQEGFAPFTWRGRVRDLRNNKIVIPWENIRKELWKNSKFLTSN